MSSCTSSRVRPPPDAVIKPSTGRFGPASSACNSSVALARTSPAAEDIRSGDGDTARRA
ncbi:hypothetical protein [Actinokineospora cianjurensis]|uniref:hypothetical protein n=1 Tax=Actinokineospora cianjurensis TaxID=585224 RepID=UPI0014776365|nr:hypothetical protein [Actinokineospora cianjurensis]